MCSGVFAQVDEVADVEDVTIQADIAYLLDKAEGNYSVWHGCGHTSIQRPFIVLGGFNPFGEFADIFNEDEQAIFNGIRGNDFAFNLLTEGYDIIILDYDKGGTFIQRNAFLVQALIQEINDQLVQNGSNEQIVIMGMSMGGIVARYALAHMEHNNVPHNTRLYISFDSPHQGANVPLGLQHMIDFWTEAPGVFPVNIDPFGSALTQLFNLAAPAAKQMANPYFTANLERSVFLADLNNVGSYPNNLRKVAVANGSGIATSQANLNPGDAYFEWNHNSIPFTIRSNTYVLPGRPGDNMLFDGFVRLGISPIKLKLRPNLFNTPAIDDAPGGFLDFDFQLQNIADAINDAGLGPANTDAGRFSFVPITSALDINTTDFFTNVHGLQGYPFPPSNVSPFDAIFAEDVNRWHLSMSADIAEFLLNEVNQTFFQNENTLASEIHTSRNFIQAGREVSNLLPIGDYVVEDMANIRFEAGIEITLEEGFHAEQGSDFHALIINHPCANATRNAWLNPNEIEEGQTQHNHAIEFTKEVTPQQVNVYPNPNNGQFQVSVQAESTNDVLITVIDLLGKEVYRHEMLRGKQVEATLSLTQSPGTYFIKICCGKERLVKKLIIH